MYAAATHRARELQPRFKHDANSKLLFEKLALYFSGDSLFEERGYGSLDKGLLLVGNVGTGKTVAMLSFVDNPRKRYRLVSTLDVTGQYQGNGIEGIHYELGGTGDYGSAFFAHCFDDLGAEPANVKYMGNELNVMERVILKRYEKHFSLNESYRMPFHYTHFTSNLTPDQILALYGARIRSRLREMCNLIVVDGEDRRACL